MKIGLGITGWRRPDYFSQVIDALKNNPEISHCHCLVSIDGGYGDEQQQMREMFQRSKLNGEIVLQLKNLGCAANVGFVFNTLFSQGMDAVVMLEDDTLPSLDFLHYMISMLNRYEHDHSVFSVSGNLRRVHQPPAPSVTSHKSSNSQWTRIEITDALFPVRIKPEVGPGRADAIFLRPEFDCHGWATWRRIYREIGSNWFGTHLSYTELEKRVKTDQVTDDVKDPGGSWYFPMQLFWRRDRMVVTPDLSRIQNIGVTGGVFNPNPQWHQRNVHSEIWMGQEDGYFSEFNLISEPTRSIS